MEKSFWYRNKEIRVTKKDGRNAYQIYFHHGTESDGITSEYTRNDDYIILDIFEQKDISFSTEVDQCIVCSTYSKLRSPIKFNIVNAKCNFRDDDEIMLMNNINLILQNMVSKTLNDWLEIARCRYNIKWQI